MDHRPTVTNLSLEGLQGLGTAVHLTEPKRCEFFDIASEGHRSARCQLFEIGSSGGRSYSADSGDGENVQVKETGTEMEIDEPPPSGTQEATGPRTEPGTATLTSKQHKDTDIMSEACGSGRSHLSDSVFEDFGDLPVPTQGTVEMEGGPSTRGGESSEGPNRSDANDHIHPKKLASCDAPWGTWSHDAPQLGHGLTVRPGTTQNLVRALIATRLPEEVLHTDLMHKILKYRKGRWYDCISPTPEASATETAVVDPPELPEPAPTLSAAGTKYGSIDVQARIENFFPSHLDRIEDDANSERTPRTVMWEQEGNMEPLTTKEGKAPFLVLRMCLGNVTVSTRTRIMLFLGQGGERNHESNEGTLVMGPSGISMFAQTCVRERAAVVELLDGQRGIVVPRVLYAGYRRIPASEWPDSKFAGQQVWNPMLCHEL
jgi:hypothetical protein